MGFPLGLVGKLVSEGYMVTWHEDNVYLHDSQGKRWAEISDGPGVGYTFHAPGQENFTMYTDKESMDRVEEMAEAVGSARI